MDTHRIGLPLLEQAQAQKETTHNEALALLDIVTQAVVVAIAPGTIPAAPQPGQCWIVGAVPSGAWAGRAHAIAGWTEGGWRFVDAIEGMSVWSLADNMLARFSLGEWDVGRATAATFSIGGQQVVGARQASIAAPTGGSVVDVEARSVIVALTARLTAHGLISSA